MDKEEVLRKLNEVPDFLMEEISDFIEFLKTRVVRERFEATLLSESSLAKDWLRPEEDKAWKDL
ncbi:MAG: DUF2281 domain-containing protein [candidate division Zixibacteria bacterium]|nr:DUF2281 domain-containing protein [candidate division Zixibacteria bacterium]